MDLQNLTEEELLIFLLNNRGYLTPSDYKLSKSKLIDKCSVFLA